jgi:putative hydrolase of the HAD superfamily
VTRRPPGQTLLVDADDTLWENNVFFERVIHAFIDRMSAHGHLPETTRETLHEIERVRTRTHGYGIGNFRAALRQTVARLVGPDAHATEHAALEVLCDGLAREVPVVLDGVLDTLRELAGRHRLILFTKGDPEDQIRKLHRARLRRFFHQVDVVREKDTFAYACSIVRHGLDPRHGWMIGNSPRSDILPALDAGLGAIFSPHAMTWALEQSELPAAADRLVVLQRFDQLTAYF